MNTQHLLSLILLSAQLHPATLWASNAMIASVAPVPNFAVRTSQSQPIRTIARSRLHATKLALARPAITIGQSSTLLPDGSVLLVGGESSGNWSAVAELRVVNQAPATLEAHLRTARAYHTSTLLPNGKVLIFGGVNSDGLVSQDEIFEPGTRQFAAYHTGLSPRAHHTATVLTNGSVLFIGGVDENEAFIDRVELWDYRSQSIQTVNSTLTYHRKDATATLETDGRVRIHGGKSEGGTTPAADEFFDPETGSLTLATGSDSDAQTAAPSVVASIPAQDARDIRVDAQIAIRFSVPADVRSVNASTAHLQSSDGSAVQIKVVPAENGRLAFFTPRSSLSNDTTYNFTLQGAHTTDGNSISSYQLTFRTAKAAAQPSSEQPGNSSANPNSQPSMATKNSAAKEDGNQTPLQAPPGTTALSGFTKTIFGKYLPNVTFTLDCDGKKASAFSDAQGRFLITSQASGHCELEIDGTTAHDGERDFGRFFPGVNLTAGQTSILPYTVWMTPIDHAHEITIPSPTVSEVVITHPNLNGLELHLPPRTVIRDYNGQVVTRLGITPIPIRRPPFPLPQGVPVPIYFTIQPGGAFVEVGGSRYGTGKGAQLIYPNTHRAPAGTPFSFWDYDPDGRDWYVYGKGHVGKNRRSIVPDPGVVIHRFTGAMVADPTTAPPLGPPPPGCEENVFAFHFCLPTPQDPALRGGGGQPGGPGAGRDPAGNGPNGAAGDPVDPSTGLFVYQSVDYVLPDVIPFTLRRTYRQGDPLSRSFGIGTSSDTDIFLIGDTFPYTYQDLILPDGSRVHFTRTSPGTSYDDAIYKAQTHSGALFGATISWNSNSGGWSLLLRNGARWSFPDSFLQTNPAKAAITAIQDRYGNTLSFVRDTNTGVLTRVVTQNGRFLSFTLDSDGRVTQVHDNLGRTTTYQYDEGGRLTQVTNPAGGITRYTYDANDQMLSITDPRGNVMVTNAYDSEGRVQQQTLADGSSLMFSYTEDVNGNIIQTDVTNPRGNVRRMLFNTNGYFSGGQMTSEIHALGKPEQQTWQYSWDPSTGLLQSATDSMSRTISYSYDGLGNATKITWLPGTAEETSISTTYDQTFNNPLTLTDALNRTTRFTYDNLGNLTKTISPSNISWTYTYNASGQLLSAANGVAGTLTFEYSSGLLSGSRDNSGNHSYQLFDPIGRVTQRVDALGNTTSFQYDSGNRVVKTTDGLGGMTQFAWDSNTNLLSLTDANSSVTTFAYDSRDHQITRSDPLQHATNATYNQNGNLSTATDRKGQVTALSYDTLDRVTQVTYADKSTKNLTYDAGNRLTQIRDSSAGTISRNYDNLDRLLSETGPQGTVSYTYDKAGERTSMTAGNQATINYSYDADGRISQIAQGSNSVGFTYDAAGRRSTTTLPSGVSIAYSYDGASHLSEIDYAQSSNLLGNLTYTYDAAGRKTSVGGSFAGTALPQALANASYSAANQLTQWGSSTLTYDANGNMLSDGTSAFTWNARNQLVSISGATNAAFAYDPVGRRQAKVINSSQTNFLFDGGNIVQEQGIDGSVVGNILTGVVTDESLIRTDAGGTHAFLTDALGSTVALAEADGTLSTQYRYDPFGNTNTLGAGSNNSQYTGRENDFTNLYYYRARYYSPSSGRFISEDPIGFASGQVNLFEYAMDSPLNFRDPSGCVTVNLGVAGGYTVGGVGGQAFAGVVVDGNGNVGFYYGGGGGAALGGGGSIGAQVGASNGRSIDDFGGPFYNNSVGAGDGVDVTGDTYAGKGTDGNPVLGGSFTVGWGLGASAFSGFTGTNIIPLGHLWPPSPSPSQPHPK